MDVSAADVKRLREKTGAGMMDCKNALVKSGGDFDKAVRLLKEQGLAAAAKKSGRATGAGKIFIEGAARQGASCSSWTARPTSWRATTCS